MTQLLSGRKALVTGSTDGIGAAVARELALEGAHVVVTGRSRERGEAVVTGILAAGGSAELVVADLVHDVPALAAAAGDVDVLVNNAAMLLARTPTAAVSAEVFDTAFAVSVRSAFLLTGSIAPRMAARGSGAVVNLGSVNGLRGMAGSALYSATKAAVHSLTTAWAAEFGPSGVRVNTVAPGPTMTDKIGAVRDQLQPFFDRAPSRRPNSPREVARAVVFLASDEAANVHAVTLTVDGGWSAV